jgi:N-acetyl-anhydromuramyl-L-alanine amidase AmpD
MNQPSITNQPLPNHWGRGRPDGLRPVLLVMHIQDGYGNPWGWFNSQGTNSPNSADCTIWNPRATNAQLYRYLRDEDTAWTNGGWSEPINHQNPVIQNLYTRQISTNDIALTIEHEGHPGDGLTEAQFQRTAAICAYWCQKWNIPADRNHIIGHYEIGPHKYCPGDLFPFSRLVARVQELIKMPNFDPNPNKLSVGAGMLAKLQQLGQVALTPERYTSDSSSQLVASGGFVLFANKTATGPEWEVVAVQGQ